MKTLRGRRGGTIGGLTRGGGGGIVAAMMRPLTTVVVSRGERRVVDTGGVTCVAVSLTCGMRVLGCCRGARGGRD